MPTQKAGGHFPHGRRRRRKEWSPWVFESFGRPLSKAEKRADIRERRIENLIDRELPNLIHIRHASAKRAVVWFSLFERQLRGMEIDSEKWEKIMPILKQRAKLWKGVDHWMGEGRTISREEIGSLLHEDGKIHKSLIRQIDESEIITRMHPEVIAFRESVISSLHRLHLHQKLVREGKPISAARMGDYFRSLMARQWRLLYAHVSTNQNEQLVGFERTLRDILDEKVPAV